MASVTADPVAAGTVPPPTSGLGAAIVDNSGTGIPVKRSEAIVKNCFITIKSSEGFAYNGVDTSGHVFGGVAAETVTGAAGADTTPVKRKNKGRFWATLSGGAAADLGQEALLKYNNTVQTAATTASIKVGRIIAMNAAFTLALIQIDSYC